MDTMMDNHARVARFLQQKTIAALPAPAPEISSERCVKAGLVPFTLQNGEYRFCVMKPVAEKPELGAPEFQLCKGTRMRRASQGWVDMMEGMRSDAFSETLKETALREGIEELGLELELIDTLYDVGLHAFFSASTGKRKWAWMFAASVISVDGFLPLALLAGTTAERRWVNAAEFVAIGRSDHLPILQAIETSLRHYPNA